MANRWDWPARFSGLSNISLKKIRRIFISSALLLIAAAPITDAVGCMDVTASTLSQLNDAISAYNFLCSTNDRMTITLAATISITSTTASINNNTNAILTIKGGGTLDGLGQRQILDVADGVVVIENLQLINGNGGFGGAIRNSSGNVSIMRGTLMNNHSNLGGAINNGSGGSVSVYNSTLRGNSAEQGGAIFTQGDLLIEGSAFDHNSASEGGAIYNDRGNARIINSTLSANSALPAQGHGGAVYFYRFGGTLEIVGSTIVDNYASMLGGGLRVFNPFGQGTPFDTVVKNTIIASNSPSDCSFSSAGLAGSGKNFDTDGNCRAAFGSSFATVTPEQLNLGPLGDYGGATETHVIRLPSVAYNAATDCNFPWAGLIEADQREFMRPFGGACDVGAFELGATDPLGGSQNGDPDHNGMIDPIDGRICTQQVLLPDPPAPGLFPPCDANDDGAVDDGDLALIGNTYLGIGDRIVIAAGSGIALFLLLGLALVLPLPCAKHLRLAVASLLLAAGLLLTGCGLFTAGAPGLFATFASQFITIGVQNMPGGGLASFGAQTGGFTFEPSLFDVLSIQPRNGFELITSLIDNANGRVLWVIVNPHGGLTQGYILELQITDTEEVPLDLVGWDPSKLFLSDAGNAVIPAGSYEIFP